MKPLFKHQAESIEFFRGKPATFDASDPGTGKTRVAIEIARTRQVLDPRAILVICPKSIMKAAWANDIRQYAPEATVSIAYAEIRAKAFAAPADFYIINHDGVKWLAQQPLKFFRKFSTMIIDECGAFKHPTSQRSKALVKISKHFDFRHGMNGTPAPNSVVELHNQYRVLDGGKRLGKSWYAFRSAVCEPQQNGPLPTHIKWTDRAGAQQAAADLVRDMTLRHGFEECIDIPPNHLYCVPFVLKPSHMKQYRAMQKARMLALKDGVIDAVHAAAVSTKLAQIASGAVYEAEDLYHKLDNDRYELVMDMAEQAQHSLVFFVWQHQKEELLAEAERRGLTYAVIDGTVNDTERNEAIRLFESGFYRVLFLHPQSTAHGLTLVRATRTIWASPTFNLEHFLQGNKRFHRAGQTQKTETIVVVAEDTIDEHIFRQLTQKKVRQDALLMEMKETA